MQRKGSGASSMVGQSASGVVGDFHSVDSRPNQRSRDSSASPVTKRTYIDHEAGTFASALGDGRVAARVRAPTARSKREFGCRSVADPLENRRAANEILSESMGRSRKNAKDKLSDLFGERAGALRVTRRRSMVPATEREAQFQDETSFTVFGEGHQSTGDFPKDPVHDRGVQGVSIEASIDQPRSSEPSSISRIARLTTSRRDGEEDSSERVEQAALHAAGTSINRANKRLSGDYPAGNETESRERNVDFATKRRGDLARNRSDREIAARQARSDAYALDNRSDAIRRGSNSDYLNFDFAADDSANWRAKDGDADVIASDTESGVAPVANRVGISEIGNQTGSNSEQLDGMDCSTLMIRERKPSGVTESSEDRFARMKDASTTPGDDVDTVERPFTGFEGSQKFPAKINRDESSPPMVSQVEKFDWRRFNVHKENVLEESDLPKSTSRDTLHHPRETSAGNEDVETNEEDRNEEIPLEQDQKWNDTRDESLPGSSSDKPSPSLPKSQPEEFATVTADGDIEVASIDVTVPSVKSTEKTNITILGLFEMTHGTVPRPEGSSELQAAKLAVERVNELDILGSFRLRLIYNDTKVSRQISRVDVRAG